LKGRTSFFEKKEAKKLSLGGHWTSVPIKRHRRWRLIGTAVRRPQEQKFFGYFFSKK
jgi:hypothetical protein